MFAGSVIQNENLIVKDGITDNALKYFLNHFNNKKITKEELNKSYIKIKKKIHPDVSPETARLSSIVNEAKDLILKNIA